MITIGKIHVHNVQVFLLFLNLWLCIELENFSYLLELFSYSLELFSWFTKKVKNLRGDSNLRPKNWKSLLLPLSYKYIHRKLYFFQQVMKLFKILRKILIDTNFKNSCWVGKKFQLDWIFYHSDWKSFPLDLKFFYLNWN